MQIRTATDVDFPVLAEMNYQLIKDEGHANSMKIPELECRMKRWLNNNYCAALIEVDSKVVGYVLWRVEAEYLYIRQFFIHKSNRRRNIGTGAIQLLKAGQWQGVPLRLEVLVNNHRGRSFWQAVEFEEYSLTMTCSNG